MHTLEFTGAALNYLSKACLIMSKTHLHVFLYILASRETKQKSKKKVETFSRLRMLISFKSDIKEAYLSAASCGTFDYNDNVAKWVKIFVLNCCSQRPNFIWNAKISSYILLINWSFLSRRVLTGYLKYLKPMNFSKKARNFKFLLAII